MNVPECVTVSKTHHTGFWEHRVPFSFFPPFHSPSLFNSTLLLPCHSLIFLSLLWFKSSAALFHFLVLSPFLRSCMLWWAWGCWASVVSSRGMAPEQRSRFEDEWMWHSAIILSLFSLVSLLLSHLPLLLFTPLFPIFTTICPWLSLPVASENDAYEGGGETDIASWQNCLYLFFWCVYVLVSCTEL